MKTITTTILFGILAVHLVRAADETTTNSLPPKEITPATPDTPAAPAPALPLWESLFRGSCFFGNWLGRC